MNIELDGGNARQRELWQEAMDLSLYPWDRLDHELTVGWRTNPTPRAHNEYAVTEISSEKTDLAGRPRVARIWLMPTLELEGLQPLPEDPDRLVLTGALVYREIVVHELAHVFMSWLTVDHVQRLCDAFGGTLNDWDPEGGDWPQRIMGAVAETFKDVYLPRQFRQWDNRTSWRLPRERYDAFLDVVDEVCSIPGGEG